MKKKFKKRHLLGSVFCLLAFYSPTQAQSEMQNFNGHQYYQEGEHWYLHTETEDYQVVDRTVIIKYNDGTTDERITNLENQFSLTRVRKNVLGYYTYLIPVNANIFATANALKEAGIINILDLDYYVIGEKTTTPSNQSGWDQYHVRYVKADNAWNITTGSPNVKVAVLDWGIKWDHPYIGPSMANPHSNIYCNPSDTWPIADSSTSGNGTDDDNNGYTDDYKGWDFRGDNDVRPDNNNWLHGTMVAGIIAAKRDSANNFHGIAGGGDTENEGVKIIAENIGTSWDPITKSGQTTPATCSEGILYAVNMGAQIINMSLGWDRNSPVITTFYKDAIKYAYNRGVVIIASAGNKPDSMQVSPPILYPACSPYVIGVGGCNHDFEPSPKSFWGKEMSVAAPNHDIVSTSTPNSTSGLYNIWDGTSFSTPIVSGIAALMFSVNECLAGSQVRDILENTTETGFGTTYVNGHSDKLGHGIVDAEKAVIAAKGSHSRNLDLFIKDSRSDFGFDSSKIVAASNEETSDASPDIWVRNQDDGINEHQNPEYNPGYQSYVYVRVRNKSCSVSYGNEILSLYWSKALTMQSWPENWDGTKPHVGNLIASKAIPVILPGQEAIVKFEWNVPYPLVNPSLLARIEKGNDEEITVYPGSFDLDIDNNNNIALHSVTIVDNKPNKRPYPGLPNGGFVDLGNTTRVPQPPMKIRLYRPNIYSNPDITNNAEVKLIFDDAGWEFFYGTGQLNQEGITIVQPKEIVITKPDVTLHNINFPPETQFSVYFGFTFPTESTEEQHYRYRVSQSLEDAPEQELGGENFYITRYTPEPLDGTARKIVADTASNNKRELLQTKAGLINSISPNPASKDITVAYSLKKVNSASLVMTQMNGNIIGKYNVDLTKTTSTINIANLPTGIYTISLVCDGKLTDAQNFQKQ